MAGAMGASCWKEQILRFDPSYIIYCIKNIIVVQSLMGIAAMLTLNLANLIHDRVIYYNLLNTTIFHSSPFIWHTTQYHILKTGLLKNNHDKDFSNIYKSFFFCYIFLIKKLFCCLFISWMSLTKMLIKLYSSI